MAPSKQYSGKGGQPIGSLDMGEKGQNCNKINFPPIGKQVRVWILTATLCSVACVTIVCATIWACSIAGIGRSGPQRNEMAAHNNVLTEDMVKILWAKRHPEIGLDPAPKKESFLFNFGEHFQDNTPQNDIHRLNNDNIQPESTSKPFEDILDNQGSKIERVDDTLRSEIERFGLKQELNNSDKETKKTVENQTLVSSPNLKPALSVKDVFKRIPTDVGKYSQDFTRIEVQPPAILQTEIKAAPSQEVQRFHPKILVPSIPIELNATPDFNTKTYREPTEDHSVKFLPQEDQGVSLDLNSYSDETYYGPDSYFYSELDAEEYYNDYEQATWTGFIVEKIQDLHDWMSTDFHTKSGKSRGNPNNTIPQILSALNRSIVKGDASILLLKLRDLYYGMEEDTKYNATQSRELLTNTTNPASFGLLTLDVMLLRNLQLMAWEDEDTAANEVVKDPELFAMNALFLEPENVRKIYEELKEGQNKSSLYSERAAAKEHGDGVELMPLASHRAELTSSFYSTTDVGRGLVDFAFSTLRAAANLGRVFRQAKSQLKSTETEQSRCESCSKLTVLNSKANDTGVEQSGGDSESRGGREAESPAEEHSELDCVWIIYCRNLEKAANSSGVYGFLAKLNSLGLRLLIGELRIDRAVDALLEDILDGPKRLNCDEIFPRCSKKNAAKIILEGIVSRAPLSSSNSSQPRI